VSAAIVRGAPKVVRPVIPIAPIDMYALALRNHLRNLSRRPNLIPTLATTNMRSRVTIVGGAPKVTRLMKVRSALSPYAM